MILAVSMFLGVSLVLLFFFFAGVRRNNVVRTREMPEEYLAIISDRPPEYFVPIEDRISEEVIFLWKDVEQEASRLYRAAQFIGYQEARVLAAMRRTGGKISRRLHRAKVAWRIATLGRLQKQSFKTAETSSLY